MRRIGERALTPASQARHPSPKSGRGEGGNRVRGFISGSVLPALGLITVVAPLLAFPLYHYWERGGEPKRTGVRAIPSHEGESPTPLTATIHITPKPANTFIPSQALGAGLDGAEAGTAERVFQPDVIREMKSVGFRALTYRLRTELAIESWHWNPKGRWSESGRKQGYWTSEARAASGPIGLSFGYRLPRRGSTVDQANDDGYSRLDDGDPRSFWKSNPYLDAHFTGEPNDRHPQWFVVDLGEPHRIDTIRLRWAAPYATHYRVDYLIPRPAAADEQPDGMDQTFEDGAKWETFPNGTATNGRGGDETRKLTPQPILTRFVRVWMTESSGTSARPSRDIRDRLGYALSEVSIGIGSGTSLQDYVHHGKTSEAQSGVIASSCDPWHRAQDKDDHVEQPGFDRVVSAGMHQGQPILLPVSVLYDTPENAIAEIRYLKARHIPIRGIELGEEADGQYVMPEDYAALYERWAKALHAVDPSIKLGGPSFQTAVEGWIHWPDAHGDAAWMRRFLNHLKAHHQLADFAFFSFEWYPFDDLWKRSEEQLIRHPAMLDTSLKQLQEEGLPTSIPWIISEYGWSPFATRDEVDLPAALVNAETVARFLTLGGDVAYLYGWEPGTLNKEPTMTGATWGNLLCFLADDEGKIRYRLPAYWASRLIASAWTEERAVNRPHQLYTATVMTAEGRPSTAVYAYPLRRPDGSWSTLLINRDKTRSFAVHIDFQKEGGASAALRGPLTVWRYGRTQYEWQENGVQGHPLRSLPPARENLSNVPDRITVPPFSLCIVQGQYSEAK